MRHCIKEHPVFGKTLFCDNGVIECGIPLSFGLRVGHFAFVGGENVFFVQPPDMKTFTTEDGWRLYGGHRLWFAPEGPNTYAPDNEPIDYRFDKDTLILTQKKDPRLSVVKEFCITLCGSTMEIVHRMTNVGKAPLTGALWAVSAMAPGGVETIPLPRREGGFDPLYRISAWDYTSLGDPRATYGHEAIQIRHLPLDERYKIGVGHPAGPVCYENAGTAMLLHFSVEKEKEYPDGNVSYEAFFSPYMTEMESLSPLTCIRPGADATHTERLELCRLTQEGEKA